MFSESTHGTKVLFVITAFLSGFCAGCSRRDIPVLRVANWAGPEEIAIEEKNLDDFRETHPDLRVVLEPIPRDYKQKILTSVAGRTAPDVFLLDAINVPEFLQAEVLLNLKPFIAELGVDIRQFHPTAFAIAQRNNTLYALPKDFTPLVMYYNKKLFDKAGIRYPSSDWTWDDFVELARRLTLDLDNDGRIDQYGTVAQPQFSTWAPWVWSNRGDFLDASGEKATGYLDGEATVAALQFLLDLEKKHHVAADSAVMKSLGGDLGMFLSGRVAMAVSGHWWMPQIKGLTEENEVQAGIAPIPVPSDGEHVTILYEAGWAVARQTRHPTLAAELAIHLSNETTNRRRCAQGVAIPANLALSREIIDQDVSGLEKVFFDEVRFAREPWGARVSHFSLLEKCAEEAFAAALLLNRDLRKELHLAAQRIDAELMKRSP